MTHSSETGDLGGADAEFDPRDLFSMENRIALYVKANPEHRDLVEGYLSKKLPSFVTADWLRSKTDLSGVGSRIRRYVSTNLYEAPFFAWPRGADPYDMAIDVLKTFWSADFLSYLRIYCASDRPTGVYSIFEDYLQDLFGAVLSEHLLAGGPKPELNGRNPYWKMLLDQGRHTDLRDLVVIQILLVGAIDGQLHGDLESLGQSDLLEVMDYLNERRAFDKLAPTLKERRNTIWPFSGNDLYGVSPWSGLNDGRHHEIDWAALQDSPRPRVLVPDFVTSEWLSDKVGLSGQVKAQIKKLLPTLKTRVDTLGTRDFTSLDGRQIADLFLEGFSHPFFHPTVSLSVERDKKSFVRENSVFRPFYRKVYEAVSRSGSFDPQGLSDVSLLIDLLEGGDLELARDFAVVRGAEMVRDTFLEDLERETGFEDVVEYLRSLRHLRLWLQANGHEKVLISLIRAASDEQHFRDVGEGDPFERAAQPAVLDPIIFSASKKVSPMSNKTSNAELGEFASNAAKPVSEALAATIDVIAASRPSAEPFIRTLFTISNTALGMIGNDPSRDTVEKLSDLVAELNIAYVVYEASQPKRTPASDILARTSAARASIVTLSEVVGVTPELPEAGSIEDFSADGAVTIEGRLAATEGGVVEAEGIHAEVLALSKAAEQETTLLGRRTANRQTDQKIELLAGSVDQVAGSYRDVIEAIRADANEVGTEAAVAPAAEVVPAPSQIIPKVVTAEPVTVTEVAVPVTEFVESVSDAAEAVDSDIEVEIDAEDVASVAEAGVSFASEPVAPVTTDPEIARVNQKVWDLVEAGRLGLAYNLADASADLHGVHPDIQAEELRFASLAGAMDHATLLATPALIDEAVTKVLSTVETLSGYADETVARRVLLYPAAVEASLFHPNSTAPEVLRMLNGLGEGLQPHVRPLSDAIQRVARLRLHLSPALLQGISGQMAAKDGVEAIRQDLLSRIEQFGRANYNFGLTIKIRNALMGKDSQVGVVSALRDGLNGNDKSAIDAATTFAERFSSQSQIMDILSRAQLSVGNYVKTLDGSSRDKIVGLMTDLAKAAATYVDRRKSAGAISESDRSKLAEVVAEIRGALKGAVEAFEEAGAQASRVAGPARFAADALRSLDRTLSGAGKAVPLYAHSLVLHGDLPLIQELHFGRTMRPVVESNAELVQTLLSVTLPLLPADKNGRDVAYEQLFRRRLSDASFAGAHLMLELAKHHGVSDAVLSRMTTNFSMELDTARHHLALRLDQAQEMVEKVVRFGALSNPENANTHLASIAAVKQVVVPELLSLEERSVSRDAGRVVDIRVALQVANEVTQEVASMLDKPRNAYLDRISDLEGKLSKQDISDLRSLCESNDLLTVGEFISFAEVNGSIPETKQRMHRFQRFDALLPGIADLGSSAAGSIAEAIATGSSIAGLNFGEQSQARREEAGAVLTGWRELLRQSAKVKDSWYSAKAAEFLEQLGLDPTLTAVTSMTSVQRKQFVADFKFTVPRDTESLILPDFGSLTGGNYRVAITNTMPSEATLHEFTKTNSIGVILFVGEVISRERRLQFRLANISAQRKIILVDTASLAFSLAEQDMRPSTLIELGQPYSFAAPYKDWGRNEVPIEMFVGRRAELATLLDPHGSSVVYGGRRLGKTALLRHFETINHDPTAGLLVGFVDAQGIVAEQGLTRQIWEKIASKLPDIFKTSANADMKRVTDGITKWLDADDRRRVVVLIDEADDFVRSDAAQGYPEFLALQRLMTETGRRFKLVLSGLHNVSRAVQTGNDPIKQISSNPQRVGPIMNDELGDAEDLIVRPFAALGITFEKREDVWSLLSRASYHPVLVQTYAKHLLEAMFEEAKRTGRYTSVLAHQMVGEIFEGRVAADEVKEKFLLTLRIDQRYELLAYVAAELRLSKQADGHVDEDFTVSEIRDSAIRLWEQGFPDRRISLFEDLIDEMEGLAILRRVSNDRWALRSPAVTRLLGTRDEVDAILIEFSSRPAPSEFDPKSARRILESQKPFEFDGVKFSPLTMSQEREIITDPTPVKLVFGTEAADIDLVSLSLKTATNSFSDVEQFEVIPAVFRDKASMLERLAALKPAANTTAILVVHTTTDWHPDWIVAAVRDRRVVDRRVKVVFVGAPKHAERVALDQGVTRAATVKSIALEPWSNSFLDTQIVLKCPTLNVEGREKLVSTTGGWNAPMTQIFYAAGGTKVPTRIDRYAAEPLDDARSQSFGLEGSFLRICKAVTDLTGPRFTVKDIADGLSIPEIKAHADGIWKSAEAVAGYGEKVGIFTCSGISTEPGATSYELSKVAQRILENA